MTIRRLAGASWAGLIIAFYYRRAWRLLLAGPTAWTVPGFFEGSWGAWTSAGEAAWRAGAALAGAVSVLAAAWALGVLLLRLILPSARLPSSGAARESNLAPDALDAFLFGLALGLAALSYLSLALAASGWYLPSVIPFVVMAPALAGCYLAMSRLVGWWRRRGPASRAIPRAGRGLFIVLLLATGLAFVCALAPEKEYDALWYHLWLPTVWLDHGHPVDVLSEYVSLYPLTWELLYGDAMVLGGPVAAKLLHFACFLLLAAATWQLTRRLFAGVSPWLAAAVVVTAPTILWEATTAYADLALAFYVTLGVYALLMRLEPRQPDASGWFRLAALCLGLGAAIKHLGLPVVGLAAIGLAAQAGIKARRARASRDDYGSRGPAPKRCLREAVLLLVVAAALASPWYWRAWSASGNPLFPELFSVFGARPAERWDAITEAGLAAFKAHFGFGRSLRSILALPWAVTQHGASFAGTIGPLFLLAAPWALARAFRRSDRPDTGLTPYTPARTPAATGAFLWLASLGFGYLAVWASPFSSFQLRFLVPIVPALAVLAALGLTSLHKRSPWILVALMLLNLPPFTPLHEGDREPWDMRLAHVVRTIPVGVVVGRESEDAYLRRSVATYGAWRYLAATTAGRTLVLESGGGDNLYATRPKVPIDAALARGGWAEGPDADAVVSRTLTRLGVTHVLFDKDWLARMAREGAALASPAYRAAHLQWVYEDPHSLLYRVDPTRSSAMQRTFLPH